MTMPTNGEKATASQCPTCGALLAGFVGGDRVWCPDPWHPSNEERRLPVSYEQAKTHVLTNAECGHGQAMRLARTVVALYEENENLRRLSINGTPRSPRSTDV